MPKCDSMSSLNKESVDERTICLNFANSLTSDFDRAQALTKIGAVSMPAHRVLFACSKKFSGVGTMGEALKDDPVGG